MKSIIMFFVALIGSTISYGQNVGIGTTNPRADLEILGDNNSAAIFWDNGGGALRHHSNALTWERPVFNMFIDADNSDDDETVNHSFSLYTNRYINNTIPELNFNLNGGDSWVKSGRFGIGTTAPVASLDVNGPIKIGDLQPGQTPTAGMIIYNGTELKTYKGGEWTSMEAGAEKIKPDTVVSSIIFNGYPEGSADPSGLYSAYFSGIKASDGHIGFLTYGTIYGNFTGEISQAKKITTGSLLEVSSSLRADPGYRSSPEVKDRVLSLRVGTSSNTITGDGHIRSAERSQFIFDPVQLHTLFPELVIQDKDGYYGIAYSRMTTILVKALQEQQEEIDRLTANVSELSEMKNKLSALNDQLSDLQKTIQILIESNPHEK